MSPFVALVIANIIWGGASPIFKYALQNIPPFTLAFIRFFFAGLIFLPLAILNWQKLTKEEWFRVMLIGFFGVGINVSFYFLGLRMTESINVPIIASSGPVLVYLFSIYFLKEKPKSGVFFGMMMSLLGVLVIILSPIFLEGKGLILGAIEGNIFILIATLGKVFQTIVSREIMKKINPFQVTAITFLVFSFMFLPFIPNELSNWDISFLNNQGLLGIVYGIFLSSGVAYYLFYYGLSKMNAHEAGLFDYLDPIVAVIIAMPLLGEYPSIFHFIGSVLVFTGIYKSEGKQFIKSLLAKRRGK